MTRIVQGLGVARYAVRRCDWPAIGWTVGGRLAAAVGGSYACALGVCWAASR